MRGNKGEWGEPYAAIRILGDGKLYLADENGEKNINEWMDVLELLRHEAADRIVKYDNNSHTLSIDIFVNDTQIITVQAHEFVVMADKLSSEIKMGRGASFEVSEDISEFLYKIELHALKAKSMDKSDIFLTVNDPRASVIRTNIGFSIKSEFGHDPTLFNTAKASALVYKVENMNDDLMKYINSLVDAKGHVSVSFRCDELISHGCELEFVGFPMAARARCDTFRENLELIDPRLITVFERLLWNHFFEHETKVDINEIMNDIVSENPCSITRPEVKYPYMMKSFLYAAYCGMTASSLWQGDSQVNGGFIKVSANGEVLAHYALESDAFKSYLYNNCYLEFPSTDKGHGDYAKVYKENGEFYFRLNFQIRYR